MRESRKYIYRERTVSFRVLRTPPSLPPTWEKETKNIFLRAFIVPSVTRFRSKIIVIHFTLFFSLSLSLVHCFRPLSSFSLERILTSGKKGKGRKRKYHGGYAL